MVSPLTIHHPVVLAKRVVTVDQISNGRAVLGLGAGWQVNEHRGYGFELREPGERVHALHRGDSRHPRTARQRARQLRRAVVHADRRDVRAEAGPVAASPPRRHGRLADVADCGALRQRLEHVGHPSTVAAVTERFMTACDSEGRDPATIRRSAQGLVYITDSDARRDELIAKVDPTAPSSDPPPRSSMSSVNTRGGPRRVRPARLHPRRVAGATQGDDRTLPRGSGQHVQLRSASPGRTSTPWLRAGDLLSCTRRPSRDRNPKETT